ncbi:GTP-binding protein [Umbelopsis nana]
MANQTKARRIAVLGSRAVVYSITSKSSFDMIKIIRDKILNYTGMDNVPCIIVGNKSDLNIQRQVSEQEGNELAAQWHCPSIEASAKHNENISKVFDLLIADIEKVNNPPPEDKSNCIIS